MKKENALKLVVSVLACEVAGLFSSIFTFESVLTWYPTLSKPYITPPSWVFGPVWITLYLLMGISLYLVWKRSSIDERVTVSVYAFFVQLLLNISWSILFFGFKSPFLALIDIFALWLAIAFTMFRFLKISRSAFFLLLPYIIWVTFAVYLNCMIWVLN